MPNSQFPSNLSLEILKILFKSNGKLSMYTLYKHAKVAHSQLLMEAYKLKEDQLIDFDDESNIFITNFGKEIVLRHTGHKKNTSWKSIPEAFQRNKLDEHEFYVPKRTLL